MNHNTMKELQSDKALVCRREINCDQGGATVFMVLLADGFLIDCGSSGYAERRAMKLAEIINESGPERLGKEGLRP
ncbi:hypothetical protein [Rhizorhapis sp.]|uniref:hypothetical protein n=1 Tax=Rhizorhapis sp. TaxID=1968842 RepID=UPI002B494304|nr:hypothetical protein [Rhizorhapis sp.]HKR17675.1 hypothetical protein [Rhizorhapis sp.]